MTDPDSEAPHQWVAMGDARSAGSIPLGPDRRRADYSGRQMMLKQLKFYRTFLKTRIPIPSRPSMGLLLGAVVIVSTSPSKRKNLT